MKKLALLVVLYLLTACAPVTSTPESPKHTFTAALIESTTSDKNKLDFEVFATYAVIDFSNIVHDVPSISLAGAICYRRGVNDNCETKDAETTWTKYTIVHVISGCWTADLVGDHYENIQAC